MKEFYSSLLKDRSPMKDSWFTLMIFLHQEKSQNFILRMKKKSLLMLSELKLREMVSLIPEITAGIGSFRKSRRTYTCPCVSHQSEISLDKELESSLPWLTLPSSIGSNPGHKKPFNQSQLPSFLKLNLEMIMLENLSFHSCLTLSNSSTK